MALRIEEQGGPFGCHWLIPMSLFRRMLPIDLNVNHHADDFSGTKCLTRLSGRKGALVVG